MSMEPTYEALARPQKPIWVEIDGHRRGLIPSWYQPHPNPETIEVQDPQGVPILSPRGKPFMLDRVPIERRWAVGRDGRVLAQEQFRPQYERLYYEFFQQLGEESDQAPQPGKPENRGIPNAIVYVSVQVHPEDPRRFSPVDYEPHPQEAVRAAELYSRDGETSKPRIEALTEAYRDPNGRARLRPDEIAEVEAHFRKTGADTRQVTLDRLHAKLAAGEIDAEDYTRQVFALTDQEAPRVVRKRKQGASQAQKEALARGREVRKRKLAEKRAAKSG